MHGDLLVFTMLLAGVAASLWLVLWVWMPEKKAATVATVAPPAPRSSWMIEVHNRRGTVVERRVGTVDEVLDYVHTDDERYLQFNAEDLLEDGHVELRGLKGKVVEVSIETTGEEAIGLVGKVLTADRSSGEVEVLAEDC